ncbi:MAG: hypothetical protein HY898_29825 [Deltaproteobacteria bacterium]|nr:hypothetical protein [Deltaproteobacteria bacterium]
MNLSRLAALPLSAFALASIVACGSSDGDDPGVATVQLKNDFGNPQITGFQPPWTICKSAYQGGQFGKIEIGQTSAAVQVPAGVDYVLMVAAWNDPTCSPEKSLPISTKNVEEVVGGQTRTIAIGMTNHQGPCPPEGVPPIPLEQYNRILQLWPEYGFKAYAERAQNSQCAGSVTTDGGAEGGADSGVEAGDDAGDP